MRFHDVFHIFCVGDVSVVIYLFTISLFLFVKIRCLLLLLQISTSTIFKHRETEHLEQSLKCQDWYEIVTWPNGSNYVIFFIDFVIGCNFNLLFIKTVFIHLLYVCFNVKLSCKQLQQRGLDWDRGIIFSDFIWLTQLLEFIVINHLLTEFSLV